MYTYTYIKQKQKQISVKCPTKYFLHMSLFNAVSDSPRRVSRLSNISTDSFYHVTVIYSWALSSSAISKYMGKERDQAWRMVRVLKTPASKLT